MADQNTIENDILEEIPPPQWNILKELYRRNGDRKVYACSFIDMAYHWRVNCGHPIKLFAIKNDNWRTNGSVIGIFDNYQAAKKPNEKMISVRFFSLEDTHSTLYRILRETKYIDWKTETAQFGLINTDQTKSIFDFVKDENLSVVEFTMTYGWMLPKAAALGFDIDIPENMYLKPIPVEYAQQIFDEWPLKHLYNLNYVKTLLTHNISIGLFNTNDNSLVTCILQRDHGSLGLLQTSPAHRGKGYATIVTKAICKQLAQNEVTPTLSSYVDNLAAERFYRKLNFKHMNFLQWITIKKL